MPEVDNIYKIQRIINLLDSTFKMVTIGFTLKNIIKKELSKDKEDKDKKTNQNSNQSDSSNQNNQQNQNQTQLYTHILNKNSFKNYINN